MTQFDTQDATATLEPPQEAPGSMVVEEEITSVSVSFDEQTSPTREPVAPDNDCFIGGTGRLKTSVARVRIKPGDGKFIVNGKNIDEFFTQDYHQSACRAPLQETKTLDNMDVFVNVKGG